MLNWNELPIPGIHSPDMGKALSEALVRADYKIVVLDDDPTGIQTVHGVQVYTDWSRESLERGFSEAGSLFFVLTNSRSFTAERTAAVHREIAENVLLAARKTGKRFLLVSRGDSTLRGHYPLETHVLRQVLEASGPAMDGELIIPFFPEGGRYTIGNIHYVRSGDVLTPCGETEFAADRTFGYRASHLGEWVEEKTAGGYRAGDCTYIGLDELRAGDVAGITRKLMEVSGFGKVIVNAVDYGDLEVFCIALLAAMEARKQFLARTAAAFVRVIGGIRPRLLLNRAELLGESGAGGLIIVGSHVKRTTEQVAALNGSPGLLTVELDQHLVLDDRRWREEIQRVTGLCNANIGSGHTTLVMTRRERLDLNTGNAEDELRIATKISAGLVSVVTGLREAPGFVVAKGGITSSDVGVLGLGVRVATVLGQILPGVPVWRTGPESRFPDIPYIIFPGNVGGPDDLKQVIEILTGGTEQ